MFSSFGVLVFCLSYLLTALATASPPPPTTHTKTHNPDSPLRPPTPPLHPSAMTLTPVLCPMNAHRLDWSQRGAAQLRGHHPGYPKLGILSHWVGVDRGTALRRILWNKREGCQDPLGAWCLQQAPTKGGRPEHLLWMLFFMKVYPKQGPGRSVISASASAVDPKTHRKWVWAFIEAIAKLVDLVVSNITMWGWRGLWYFLWWRLVIHLAVLVLASIRKRKENVVKKIPFFYHTRPHTPAPRHPLNRRSTSTVKKRGISSMTVLWQSLGLTSVSPKSEQRQ